MIALLGASALTLAALQATVAAPTSAFRGCLHEAASKATSEKVSADTIETYLRSACTVQMDSLKGALVAFRMKNGMSKKAAADDLATPAEHYKFAAEQNQPQPATAAVKPAEAQQKKP